MYSPNYNKAIYLPNSFNITLILEHFIECLKDNKIDDINVLLEIAALC